MGYKREKKDEKQRKKFQSMYGEVDDHSIQEFECINKQS